MSIAVLIGVDDGLVLASDSASALGISLAPGTVAGVAQIYENANKIFNLFKGEPIGCVTFGAGSIGNSSIGTLIKDLRAALQDRKKAQKLQDGEAKELILAFDKRSYTMEGVSKIVAAFVDQEMKKQPAIPGVNTHVGFLLGGYSTDMSLGESWAVNVSPGKAPEAKLLRPPKQAGISWGGVGEPLHRLVMGFSSGLFHVLAEVTDTRGQAGKPTSEQLSQKLGPLLGTRLLAPLVFAPMPIQDAIDLGKFLVYTAIMFSRFGPGAPIVGGPIEIAAITKHEGFKWIARKHYYKKSLNEEPPNGIVYQRREGQ
jgi:hypothetical protein